MKSLIEIGYEKGVFDATGEGIKKGILDLGIKGVKHIYAHQLYLIKGAVTEKDLEFIAQHILCDPVIQYHKIISQPQEKRDFRGGHFAVEVWFKKGVTDNVGDSVKKAIEGLKLEGADEVNSGRKFIIEGNLTKDQVINITTRLLANKVVEDYKIYGES